MQNKLVILALLGVISAEKLNLMFDEVSPKHLENLRDLLKREFRTKHYIIERENLLYGTMRRENPIIWRKWRNKNQFLSKKVVV